MRIAVPSLCSSLCAVLACASPTAPTATGAWGGPTAGVVLSAGGGTVSYACGSGTIDAGWTVDDTGDFRATGTHFFEGGPIPPGGGTPHPARYTGRLRGDTLGLTVTLTDTGQVLGPFYLKRNGPPVVPRCA